MASWIAGACLTVVVAWLIALTSEPPDRVAFDLTQQFDRTPVQAMVASSRQRRWFDRQDAYILGPEMKVRVLRRDRPGITWELYGTSLSRSAPRFSSSGYRHWTSARAIRTRVGWPWRTFVSTMDLRSDRIADDISVSIPRRDDAPLERSLPYRPILPGFIANSMLYANLVLLPVVIPRAVRCWRRRCPGCGYPIGVSSNCSECGRRLPDRLLRRA